MEALVYLGLFIVVIIIMRFVGAWMLRIDEIIKNQEKIVAELKDLNRK